MDVVGKVGSKGTCEGRLAWEGGDPTIGSHATVARGGTTRAFVKVALDKRGIALGKVDVGVGNGACVPLQTAGPFVRMQAVEQQTGSQQYTCVRDGHVWTFVLILRA
jgi:hypothetical protein